MNELTLPSGHKIRNLRPDGLRPSTLQPLLQAALITAPGPPLWPWSESNPFALPESAWRLYILILYII